MQILDMENVTKTYTVGTIYALININLRIDPGEVIGLLGRNGAGKTTLINTILGILHPQYGRVSVFGKDPVLNAAEVKRQIGFVSEDQVLPEGMSGYQLFALYKSLYPSWDQDYATDLMVKFILNPNRKVKNMSKGEARQLALVLAIAHRPKFLLLDEPGGGLDPAARREFLEVTVDLLTKTETTILFSSHHTSDVERLASRLVILHKGTKFLDRDMLDIKKKISFVTFESDSIRVRDLNNLKPCLSARKKETQYFTVLDQAPDQARQTIRSQFHCESLARPLPLEELFIELTQRTDLNEL